MYGFRQRLYTLKKILGLNRFFTIVNAFDLFSNRFALFFKLIFKFLFKYFKVFFCNIFV